MRLTPKALKVFSSGLNLERESFVSLLVSGTEWWAGLAGTGPLVGTPGHFQRSQVDLFPDQITASALLKDRDGSLWIGTHSRNLLHWKNGTSYEVVAPKSGSDISSCSVTALLQSRDGNIWVGSLGRLFTVSPEGLTPVKVWEDFPRDTVNVLYEDRDGAIWVGYQTLGLAKILRDGSSVRFQKGEGLPDNCIKAIYQDRTGCMWIGTAAGLVRWGEHRESVFTTSQGLVDDAIQQVIEDDEGYLWLGTRHGLMRVARSEFAAVQAGASTTLAVRHFGLADGMQSEECTSAKPVKTADGKLWFPTTDGLVMADPKVIPNSVQTPPLYLEEVRVGNQLAWTFNPLDPRMAKTRLLPLMLPARTRDIDFRFAALDFVDPERVRFKYRIEGLDDEWSTPSPARTAHIKNIPPGSYRFRVESCRESGGWSATDCSIAFTVPPLLWQTVWFKTATGASVILVTALLLVWRERRKSYRKLRELEHEQALERERARIARDIHDEVGAGLTEVALLSELAQADLPGQANKHLDDIFKTARDLTRSLDEIVWSINPANDTLEKLISYLVEFARDFLGTASLPCRLEVPTLVPSITVESTTRHQICLAVKEVLNNIVRHAGAGEVSMGITWEQDRLSIVIKDNGRGFVLAAGCDPTTTRNGLENIATRMREINGSYEHQSTIGEGTHTLLSVKIPTSRPH